MNSPAMAHDLVLPAREAIATKQGGIHQPTGGPRKTAASRKYANQYTLAVYRRATGFVI
jgi:hypothetical protein